MDRITGVVVFLLGTGILWQGRRLWMGTLRGPGPGFFPNLVAISMIILSLLLIIPGGKEESKASRFSANVVIRICIMFVSLVTYSFALEFLGFLITSVLLMTCLFKVFGSLRWRASVLYALISVGASYLLFDVALEGNLPKGVLGG